MPELMFSGHRLWGSWVWEEGGEAGRYYVSAGWTRTRGGLLASREAGDVQAPGSLSGRLWAFLFALPPGQMGPPG